MSDQTNHERVTKALDELPEALTALGVPAGQALSISRLAEVHIDSMTDDVEDEPTLSLLEVPNLVEALRSVTDRLIPPSARGVSYEVRREGVLGGRRSVGIPGETDEPGVAVKLAARVKREHPDNDVTIVVRVAGEGS